MAYYGSPKVKWEKNPAVQEEPNTGNNSYTRDTGSPPTHYGTSYTSTSNPSPDPNTFPRQVDISKHQMDSQYLDEMRGIAFDDPGNSPWLKYQMEQDDLRQGQDRDTLARTGSSEMASQQGNMAMRGGLTSGASERLGSQNMMGQLMGQQDLSRSAAGREAAYRQQAEERQRDVLTQLPNAEYNYSNYGAELDKYNTTEWNTAEASKRLADAIGGGGDGGGGGYDPFSEKYEGTPFDAPAKGKPTKAIENTIAVSTGEETLDPNKKPKKGKLPWYHTGTWM